jgi:hypothetical protein
VIAVNGWRHTFCSSCISWNRQNLAAEQLLLEQAMRSSASTSMQNQPLFKQLSIQAGQEVDPGHHSIYFLCGVGNQSLICQQLQTQFISHFVIDFVIY